MQCFNAIVLTILCRPLIVQTEYCTHNCLAIHNNFLTYPRELLLRVFKTKLK